MHMETMYVERVPGDLGASMFREWGEAGKARVRGGTARQGSGKKKALLRGGTGLPGQTLVLSQVG